MCGEEREHTVNKYNRAQTKSFTTMMRRPVEETEDDKDEKASLAEATIRIQVRKGMTQTIYRRHGRLLCILVRVQRLESAKAGIVENSARV